MDIFPVVMAGAVFYIISTIFPSQWRQSQIVSIISAPLQMLNPATSDVVRELFDYYSFWTMIPWVSDLVVSSLQASYAFGM